MKLNVLNDVLPIYLFSESCELVSTKLHFRSDYVKIYVLLSVLTAKTIFKQIINSFLNLINNYGNKKRYHLTVFSYF